MSAGPILIFLAVAAALVYGAVKASQAAAKRRMALIAFARRHGFAFEEGESSTIEYRFPHFECFARGSNRYGYNTMRGEVRARGIWCFDYHYETTSTDSKGRSSTTHWHSSNVVIDFGRPLRPLALRSESFFDRLSGLFGFDDIDFESAEFSRAFHVKSPDRKWAYDVISQRTMELLLEAPRFEIELDATHILLRRGSRFGPGDYDAALRLGQAILDGIPADAVGV